VKGKGKGEERGKEGEGCVMAVGGDGRPWMRPAGRAGQQNCLGVGISVTHGGHR